MKPLILILLISCYSFSFSQNVVINEFMSKNKNILKDEDSDYVDWIELYNNSEFDINLEKYRLTDDPSKPDKWIFPNIDIKSKGFLIIYASGKDRKTRFLHANFKLNSSGENIILLNPSSKVVDIIPPTPLEADKSYGRLKDGQNELGFLSRPTPGESNNGACCINEIKTSKESGFYKSKFSLELKSKDDIHYTLNGSIPNPNSKIYKNTLLISSDTKNKISLIPTNNIEYNENQPLNMDFGFQPPKVRINKAVILKAQTFKNGVPTSDILTRTYFTNRKKYTFPVVSITTEGSNLFDYNKGIYVPGFHFNPDRIKTTGNYYKRGENWERASNIEIFDPHGKLISSDAVGIRISGNMTRFTPQKSLRVYFKEKYGKPNLEMNFFPKRNYNEFKRFKLRSTFGYWHRRNMLFQDDLIHQFAFDHKFNVDVQLSQPIILFLNGEYWGIHNLRERQDKYYLSSIHKVNPDKVDIVDGDLKVVEGSNEDFIELLKFVENNDLTIDKNYSYIKNKIDINNYIDYFILETFFGNIDWLDSNVKMWKEQSPDSKWRWLLFDLDAAIYRPGKDPFIHINESDKTQTFLFRELIKNLGFKQLFINRYLFHLNTSFNPKNTTKLLEIFINTYKPEVQEHILRWNNPKNIDQWITNLDFFRNFLIQRPCEIKNFLATQFKDENIENFDCNYTNNLSFIKFNVFPNPTNGILNIDSNISFTKTGDIYIYNSLGKRVYQKSVNKLPQSIDLINLEKGFYIINILINDRIYADKFIIDK